jgi:hypothetical protein
MNLLGWAGAAARRDLELEIVRVFAPALGFSLPEEARALLIPCQERIGTLQIQSISIRLESSSFRYERRNQLFTSIYLLTNNKDHVHIKIPLGNQRRILVQSR